MSLTSPLRGAPLDAVVIMTLALTLRLAMAWTIPFDGGLPDPNCAPDESAHFAWIAQLAQGRAPTWPDESASIYAAFPPPQYLAQALSLRLLGDRELGRFEARDAWARGYQSARLGSVLLGALTAGAAWLAAWLFTRRRIVAASVGILVAIYPCAVFLNAYSNADSFALFVAALHVAALARWARAGEGSAGVGAVCFTAGLVLVGKPSGFFVLPPSALWLGWALWPWAPRWRVVRRGLAATLLSAGPPLAWNAWRNGGDALGLTRYRRFVAEVLRPAGMAIGKNTSGALEEFFTVLPRSAFARFRNNDLELPAAFYWGALAILTLGLVGTALAVRRTSLLERRALAWLGAVASLDLGLVFYNFWYVDYQLQGRYLLVGALLTGAVITWAPTRVLRAPVGWWWPALVHLFLASAAIAAQITLYQHPCVPGARLTGT